MDLYLVNGAHKLTLQAPPPGERTTSALYRNQGDGRFREVTEEAGLSDWRWGMGAAVADHDNDGDPDLYVTHLGPNALWRNNGDGTFTDVAAEAGVDDPGPSTGAAFGDVDADGWLDLYVGNYVQVHADRPLPEPEDLCRYRGVRVACGPKGLPPAADRMFRNRGDGTFQAVTESSGIGTPTPRYSLDVLFLDVDDDGDADIYVAVDNGPSLLFINDGAGKFVDRGLLEGVALSEAGLTQAGMGADATDFDGDGLQDIVKTNFETEPFNLYRNSSTGLFTDHAFHAGLSATIKPLGFGAVFLDANRDGWPDLFFANGHVHPWTGETPGPFPYPQANLLLLARRAGGRVWFEDVSGQAGPGLAVRKVSRGVAVADYDGDGDLDLAINNLDDTPDLLRNDSRPGGGWLAVRTRGTVSNRDGYGARVTLLAGSHRQVREVRASKGYLSSSDPTVFFGLGPARSVEELEVRWPTRRRERFQVPGVNRTITVREGEGEAVP